ncbi:MAG: hypothetical protein ACXWWA_09155 [Chitinophagaceae bacterium]
MNRKLTLLAAFISVIAFSCTKESIQKQGTVEASHKSVTTTAKSPEIYQALAVVPAYVTYLIRKGQHYSDKRPLKTVSTVEMKFYAKFDQSGIYQTVNPANQYDINKLWGFSEGFNNQYNSARVGWGYSDGAIRLYGYVYSKGIRHSKEITSVTPGQEIYCSIKVSGSNYIFSANGTSVTLPRGTTASKASGFQQYPYFGGDEVAPHNVSIFIRPA